MTIGYFHILQLGTERIIQVVGIQQGQINRALT
jgi:hypothetical protein